MSKYYRLKFQFVSRKISFRLLGMFVGFSGSTSITMDHTWTAIFPCTEKIPDANISISNIDTFHVQRLYNYCN